jgi:hypothetical protein
MKTFRLTKRMLKDVEFLLTKVGAVATVPATGGARGEAEQAFPSHVYVSKADYKKIQKETARQIRKEYPYLNKRRVQSTVGMHLLNLGPVELDGIKEGFILVDNVALELDIEAFQKR